MGVLVHRLICAPHASVSIAFSSFYRIADSRSAPRDGAYVHGLLMEGARWDVQAGIIMDSRLKELFPAMPVINVRVSYRELFFIV